MALLPIGVNAQFYKSANQQLIEDAITGGVVIVSQSYQLEDTVTHQKFGRYGRPEFGKGYSVGVRIQGKLIVSRSVVEPWNNDPNFERYRNSHVPVRYKRTIREYSDTIVNEKIVQNECIDDLYKSELFTVQDSTIRVNQGFHLDTMSGNKNGWLIWVVSDEPIEKSDSVHNESLMIYKSDLLFGDDERVVNIKSPSTEKNVWGGIYVTPQQTSVGQVTFYLSGIIQYKGNDVWCVVSPFIKEQENGTLEDLTPVEAIKEGDTGKEKTEKTTTENKKKKKTKRK